MCVHPCVHPATFLPHIAGLRLDHVAVTDQLITLTLSCVQTTAPCPLCQRPSTKVHSSYTRTVADLPWSDRRVCLCVQTRRFVCAVKTCARRIFCERLPDLVAVYGRRTHNLRQRLQQIGLALAGRAGARLAQAQHMPISRTTLLRLVRAVPQPLVAVPRALGIDDWAQHKGHTYGTILVDLAQHQVVDLLPDRSAATVASWLQEHPGVEVISRDRGQTYTEGATSGAPEAVQVADRWHIAKNLGEALERYLARHQGVLQEVARAVAGAVPPGPGAAATPAPEAPPPLTRRQQEHDHRRARRLARYEEVRARFQQGQSQRAIAAHMGVNGKTVRRYLQAETFAEMQPRRRRRQVDPYVAYLQQRWAAGCHNGRRLFRELKEQGYRGGRSQVADVVARLRRAQGLPPDRRAARHDTPGPSPRLVQPLSPRQVAALFLRQPDDLTERQQHEVQQLCAAREGMATVYHLAQAFMHLLRERRGQDLAAWAEEVRASGIADLMTFAAGMADDPAVRAGLTLPWSNGPTEGFVNKLKMLKRQMFGRAKIDLLRQRLLLA